MKRQTMLHFHAEHVQRIGKRNCRRQRDAITHLLGNQFEPKDMAVDTKSIHSHLSVVRMRSNSRSMYQQ
jgi:hypothetical protein